MAGFQIRRQGFKTAGALVLSVIDDMLANGFTFGGTGEYTKPAGPTAEKFSVTLEAGPNVDPLNKTELSVKQPWRINFSVYDNATAGIVVGAATALPDGGATLPLFVDAFTASTTTSSTTTTQIAGVLGPIGQLYSPLEPAKSATSVTPAFFANAAAVRPHYKKPKEGFINRSTRVWLEIELEKTSTSPSVPAEVQPVQPSDTSKDLSASYPMSYFLSITDRGFFLDVWEGAISDVGGNQYSWVLVQRPVDRDTGAAIVSGKAPLFCVNCVGNEINRFIVREADVLKATNPISAVKDTADCSAIINSQVQVAVSEDNQYVVSFPSRLNTPRYAYTYELDMIGYTSATVVSQNTEVPLTLYGESTPRNYVAIHANMENSNGMRIVALVKGGGIS